MLDDAPKAALSPEEAERSRKKKEKRLRQQQQKKLLQQSYMPVTPVKEPSALLLESVLQDLNLTALAVPLASLGLDNQSIAQADDDDWEDFGMAVSDGRRVRSAMRAAMGYDPEV